MFVRENLQDYYFIKLEEALKNLGIKVFYPKKIQKFFPIIRNLVKYNCKILHIHWLFIAGFYLKNVIQLVFKLLIFMFQIFLIKYLMGVKIVWTVHNLYAHDSKYKFIERMGKIWFSKQADIIICHCNKAVKKVSKEFKVNPIKIRMIPHGNYIDCYENKVSKEEARKNLSLSKEDFLFLYFGRIQPYKGVDELVNRFNVLNLKSNVKLLIAGKVFNRKIKDFLTNISKENQNIILFLKRIDDDKIQIFMNAADVIIIPYKRILTSGVVLLAMSFSKPIIAPKIGCIDEILDDKGAILYNLNSKNGLKDAINNMIELKNKIHLMGDYNYQKVKKFDWLKIGKKTAKIYYLLS